METPTSHSGCVRRPGALVVDDIPTTQYIGMIAMRAAGFRVVAASDGKEAVDLVKQNQFDVVLMDINMPRMNGLEATEAIRARELHTCRHLPIVLVTGETAYADESAYRRAGADAYLPKPFHFEQLLQVLDALKIGTP